MGKWKYKENKGKIGFFFFFDDVEPYQGQFGAIPGENNGYMTPPIRTMYQVIHGNS